MNSCYLFVKNNPDIIFIQANKSNVTVVLNRLY